MKRFVKRFVSVISAGALASATAIAPISSAPALTDEDIGVRAYMSFKFGSGDPVKDSTRYGFQLNRSWDNNDEVIDPFAAPSRLNVNVLDFAINGEGGLAKANVLGLDTITVYDVLTGRAHLDPADGTEGVPLMGPLGAVAILIGGLTISCFAADLNLCGGDDNKRDDRFVDDDDTETTTAVTSDARLKRDVTYLATLESGIKIYSFRYLLGETVHVGVMAQDLLMDKTTRHAVVLRPNGFYAVNYASLGLEMTTLKAWQEQGRSAVLLRPALAQMSSLSVALAQ